MRGQINAGDLKYRITLKSAAGTDPDTRLPTDGEALFSCWAMVEALKGREYFAAAQIQAEKTIKITIRKRKDIDETMKVIFDGQPYDIHAILPDYKGKGWMTLMCSEVL